MNPKNLYILPSAYHSLFRDVKRQKRFLKAVIEPEINNAIENNDGSLDEEDFRKIRSYYGFGVPAIVGEGFCTLRGKPMNKRERLANTYQGALTGLYDDFFDKTHLDHDSIRKIMDRPEGYEASSSLEKLFVRFLEKVHENLYDKAFFTSSFDQVFNAQVESNKQVSESLSMEMLKEVTFRKGGNSLLFYRSVFEHALRSGEESALFNAGGLMQLGNDIFDVYKDESQNVQTLVTTCGQIDQLRKIFSAQLKKTISLIKQTDFDKHDIQAYLQKLILGISRCYVCMDQLERLQKKTGGRFSPSEYSRKELICDMEKPGNILRSLRYFTGYDF